MKKKEDLRVTKTKKSLYEGLMKLMKDDTFENIKVSDICDISLVNRSTFYDHFSDKYELLESLIKDLEDELSSRLEQNHELYTHSKQYYMSMIKILLDHICDNISIYSSIIKNNNNSIASDMFKDTILKDVSKNIENNMEQKPSVPIDIITLFYVTAVIHVCVEYVKTPSKYTKEEILEYLSILIPDNIY